MDKQDVTKKTALYVEKSLCGVDPGHDWWHIQRVRNYSKYICSAEGANAFVVELAALLHDIADYKFHHGDEEVGPRKAREWLSSNGVARDTIDQVATIIRNMNYKGPLTEEVSLSLEHAVVQDADRLDAIGAIGIARAFSFGGHFKREIYNPTIKPNLNMNRNDYRNNKGTVINHFYEKLLLVKDKMLTETGKKLAVDRTCFMEEFLEHFFHEWNMSQLAK